MKKLVKSKNRYGKIVNNQTRLNHKLFVFNHKVSKELIFAYQSLTPIYEELDKDFQTIDLVDLNFYERWLNE